MSYWHGHAPNYSRRVEGAYEDSRNSIAALLQVLKSEYPKGAEVRVVHHRGEFTAHVTGWDTDGCRVHVRNVVTGKDSKWWAAQVERIGGAA